MIAGRAAAEESPVDRLVDPLFRPSASPHDPAPWGLGPIDTRDPFPFSLARFTLPVESPETVRAGQVALVAPQLVWANTQVIRRDSQIDAEVLLGYVQARVGLTERLEVRVEVPFHYLGGGRLDGLIEGVHGIFGVADKNRDERDRNLYLLRAGNTDIARGARLGDLAVGGKIRILDGGGCVPAVSFSAWSKFPTASSASLGRQGVDLAASVQASDRFGPLVLYAGGGWTWISDTHLGDLTYRRSTGMVWLGAELGLLPGFSFEVHTWLRTSLLRESSMWNEGQTYVVTGFRYRGILPIGDGGVEVELNLGLIENFAHFKYTADVGFVGGVGLRF